MRIERKPASITLHWRGIPAPSAAGLRGQCQTVWWPLMARGVLEWLPFDGGIELRSRGANKGGAVKAIYSGNGSAGAVAYPGDDVTDGDAFRAVGTQGLGVLVRPDFRETAADFWITPPHGLLAFIGRWRRGRAAS